MNYGDGANGHPLTALDICGHEMGHGVQQFTSNVANGSSGTDEANALNEGLSDIWGASVEHQATSNKQTWLMGEDVFNTGGNTCLRDLQNPKSTTAFEGQHPDTYHGQFWDNAGEPHNNSTILSHWFYLLSQGGIGTNDIGSAYSVNGIGMDAAEQIVYEAESNWLHAGADYAAARNAMIAASRVIAQGAVGSCQEIAVTNAWYAVGVGGQYGSLTITGPDAICYNSTATYTVSGFPIGAIITWNVSNSSGISFAIAPNGLSLTITNISTASSLCNITVSTSTCSSTSKIIALGVPAISGNYTNTYDGSFNNLGYYPAITNPACTGYYINTNMQVTGAASVNWTQVSSSNVVGFSQTNNDIRFYLFGPNQNVVFQVTASNSCGTTTNQFKWLSSNCGNGGGGSGGCNAFTISPNPAKGRIRVVVPSIAAPCFAATNPSFSNNNLTMSEVRVYDNLKLLKKIMKVSDVKQVDIDINGLTPGIYSVVIRGNNNYIETQTIIVQ